MSMIDELLDEPLPDEPPNLYGPPAPDTPRELWSTGDLSDRLFRGGVRGVGSFVLILTGAVGVFLGIQLIPTLRHYGLSFFTQQQFNPELNLVGVAAAAVGTIEVSVIALVIAFPLALLTALYISVYAPRWAKSTLVSLIDLMAAVPSIVYGAWGLFLLMPNLVYVERWLDTWFGWIPIFSIPGADPHAAQLAGYRFEQSAFVAGCVVAMMVIPLACAVMRNVFDQAPMGEQEGAYALGATRWGVVRAVVLPFGRGGIVGGTMLGLGRALGETIGVLLVTSQAFHINIHVLADGTVTISSLIADRFGDSSAGQLKALLAAGFVLFMITIVINTLAAAVVSRSRSGSGVDA